MRRPTAAAVALLLGAVLGIAGATSAAAEGAPTTESRGIAGATSAAAEGAPTTESPTDPPVVPTDPYAPVDPTFAVDCKSASLDAVGVIGNGNVARIAATGTDAEAPAPNPPITYPFGSGIHLDYYFINPAWPWSWTIDVWTMDGRHWSRSGTTTPCHGFTKGYVKPVVPAAVTACGGTLADITFASTRHIRYWHDTTTVYATADQDWMWAEGSLGPPHSGWIPPDNVPSNKADTVHIDGYDLLKPPPGCAHTVPGPYDPQPAAGRPSTVPSASMAPEPTAAPSTVPVTPATTNAATATATPSPAPSPSATGAATATTRVATTTGLGVAGGLAGTCVLAAAGAFVVRKRWRPAPSRVMLDEPAADDPVD